MKRCRGGADDGVDDGGVVSVFVRPVTRLGHELLDDVGEIDGKRFAHLRARVLARHVLAHRHETRKRGSVPCALASSTSARTSSIFSADSR